MKFKSSTLAVVISVLIVQFAGASPNPAQTGAGIESIVPREGLQFYFEIASSGLGELARSEGAMATLSKVLSGGPLKVGTGDLAAFVMANSAVLSNARLAIIGYAENQTAVVIEAASDSAAVQLSASVRKFLVVDRPQKGVTNETGVSARGRVIVAGSRALVARLSESNSERSLADDQEFVKARNRFSNDSLFAFIELSTRNIGLTRSPDEQAALAQTPAMLAALSGIPYAVALGGTINGDSATVRALLLNGSNGRAGTGPGVLGGLLTSTASSGTLDQSRAASFAATGADLFVDLMIDWDKLLDAFQSAFAMFSQAAASGANGSQSSVELQSGSSQNADLLGMMEASLGFSIRHDLIPTLGNEVAITLSDMSNPSKSAGLSGGQAAAGRARKNTPRFMLMLAVRDEVKFEKLLGKLFNGPKNAARPFTQSIYRGATIKSGKDVSYTMTDGFLLAGGSATEIRRALDAHALGNSLGSTPEFRQAMASSRQATLQAYLSSRLSKDLLDSLARDAKSGGVSQQSTLSAPPLPIGLSLGPDDDGLLIEANLPTSVLTSMLTAVFRAKPARYGITSTPGTGISTSGAARPGNRTTPRMTDDDLRFRRP